jgi:signal transduction histidine kinase/CheY-like chemotaxis protein
LGVKADLPITAWRRVVRTSWCVVIGIAALGFLIGVFAENRLPTLVSSGQFTTTGSLLSWTAAVMGALALAALVIKTRAKQVLYLWLILALTTFCGDLFLSTFGGARFTLGWYAGRASGFVSGGTLFVLFLMRFAAQQRLSAKAVSALRERTTTLQLEVARRAEAEERLVQSQKVEALGQLTGGIAHDFNNLLAVVVGNLDLLRGSPRLDDRSSKFLDNALNAADRGTKLASQLLVFSRSQQLELKALVVADVIAGMQELLTRTLGPQIRIRIQFDAARTAVLSEQTQLELAVLNLAINARDAMPQGGALTISVTPVKIARDAELAPGDYVRISVADTGSGMTAEVAARAFDPFYTTKEPGRGTGLGLSQVFGIAGRGGGTARIESRAGYGTTVHVFLRCIDMTATPADHGSAAPDPSQTGPLNVLVVDDDPDVRQFLVNALAALGHNPTEAADGARGLAVLEATTPDLIVVDFAMPGMNGAEFCKRVRMRFPYMPVVFVTGYADTGMIEGVVGESALILRKPFRSFELKAILGEAIRRRAQPLRFPG